MNHRLLDRIAWLQALTVLTLLLPLLGAGLFIGVSHQRIVGHLADLEPRYARLLGIMEHRAELQASSEAATAQLKRLAYPAGQDVTQAGNDAQQRIRALFADSKLDIVSIQVLPPKEEGEFDRLTIELRVEGDLTGLHNALTLLSVQTPLVTTQEATLQTIGAVKPASVQRLSGQFVFSTLRARS